MDVHVVENVSHEFILDWIETTNGQLIFTSNNPEDEDCGFFIVSIKEGEEVDVSCTDTWELRLRNDAGELSTS